jgi:ribosomal protein S18 acetylase RimI-like enzyme
MPVTYRYAHAADADRLFYVEKAAFPGQSTSSLEYFVNRLNDREYFETDFIAAILDGEIVGFAELSFSTTRFDRGTEFERVVSNGFLWNLAVLPEFQRQGIGSELLNRAEQWTAEQNCSVLQLEVEESKPENVRFYENRGYKLLMRIPSERDSLTFYMLRIEKELDK